MTELPQGGISAKDVVLDNPYIVKSYARDMESITGKAITKEQIGLLKDALQKQEFVKLEKVETAIVRKEFNSSKNRLILEWEQNTGQKWPTYTKDIYAKAGNSQKPYIKTGQPHQVHHIIQVDHGGPNKWWNMHPSLPSEHSKIHGKESIGRTIFYPKGIPDVKK